MFRVVLSDTYQIEIMQVSVLYVTTHFGDSTSSDIAPAMHDTRNIGTASAVLPNPRGCCIFYLDAAVGCFV